MEFLKRILGIQVAYLDEVPKSMPNYIDARYKVQKVMLNGKGALFVYPKEELDSISAVNKHLERIAKTESVPAILVPERLTARQKEYLLRYHTPFIVEGKQIYLPFMAVYLQERNDGEKLVRTTMLPSAQLLLLYYIYHGCGEQLSSDAVRKLEFTATSISRASRQLEAMGLIHTMKRGVQKVLCSDKTPEELFKEARERMLDPVKRTIYVPKAEIKDVMVLSSYSALSEYTMLNPPALQYYAVESISGWEKCASGRLQDVDDQCAIELWRYDPKKLSANGCVDRLSLALAIGNDTDERVEEAVEEMLAQVWRDIDGKRN